MLFGHGDRFVFCYSYKLKSICPVHFITIMKLTLCRMLLIMCNNLFVVPFY